MGIVYTDFEHPEVVWLLSIVGGIISWIHTSRRGKQRMVKSHFDTAIGYLWMSYGITITIIIGACIKNGWEIYPIITTLTAIPTIITGILIKYRPLIFGGSLFWVFAVVSFSVSPIHQILVGAVALIVGYLIPGYTMKPRKS